MYVKRVLQPVFRGPKSPEMASGLTAGGRGGLEVVNFHEASNWEVTTMADLFILSDPKAFDEGPRKTGGPGYNPYYRFVICRALLIRLIYNSAMTKQDLVNLLNNAITAFAGAGIVDPEFFEIFPINYNGRKGFVVVDQTKGCFPLVLYPDRPQEGKEDRKYAFSRSLIEVKNNISSVEAELRRKTFTDWNQTMRDRLLAILPSP
jgi:hypothetical protein